MARRRDRGTEEALKAWRLAANQFYVEAAECRESLRALQARMRDGATQGELIEGVRRERARIGDACEELLAGLDHLRACERNAAERACAREEDVVGELGRRVATHVRRRTRRA